MDTPLVLRVASLVSIVLLPGPQLSTAAADAIRVNSAIALPLAVTPVNGTVAFLDPTTAQAFAQAANSLGEFDQHSVSSSGGASAAIASVDWAAAAGAANASELTASAASGVAIPRCGDARASSVGRSTLSSAFVLLGGTGSTNVDFSLAVTSAQSVLTSSCAVAASSEVIAAMELDGQPLIEALLHSLIVAGPEVAIESMFDDTVRGSRALDFGVVYFLLAEADAESLGVTTVPEPPLAALIGAGLALYAAVPLRRNRRARSGG